MTDTEGFKRAVGQFARARRSRPGARRCVGAIRIRSSSQLCHKEGKKAQALSKKRRLDEGATAGGQAKALLERMECSQHV